MGRNAKDQFTALNALSHSIHLIGGRFVFQCRFKNKRMVHAPRNLIQESVSKLPTDTRRITFVHQISGNTSLKSSPDTTTRVSNTESQHNHKSVSALQQPRRADRTQQYAKKTRTNGMPPEFFRVFSEFRRFFRNFMTDQPVGLRLIDVGRNAKDQFTA